MRVAALYDIHGNLPALEAVLDEVDSLGVDAIVFGGDIAAGPLPRETLARVRATAAPAVRGNGDRRFVETPAAAWVWEQLDEDDVAWLEALPPTVELDGVLYCHATPRSDEEIVTDATTDEKLTSILEDVEASLVVGGHTHMQQRRGRYANAGSVGMPYEDKPGAYWAMVDGGEVDFRRTEYDLERAAAAIRASGWPDADEFAAENVLTIPTREQAIAAFGG